MWPAGVHTAMAGLHQRCSPKCPHLLEQAGGLDLLMLSSVFDAMSPGSHLLLDSRRGGTAAEGHNSGQKMSANSN